MIGHTGVTTAARPAMLAGTIENARTPESLATKGARTLKDSVMIVPDRGRAVDTPAHPERAASGPIGLPVIADAIPAELKQHARWFVWRTVLPDGCLFEERRLYRVFQEYPTLPGVGAVAANSQTRGPLRGTPALTGARGFMWALYYLRLRSSTFDGLAYVHEDGTINYFPINREVPG